MEARQTEDCVERPCPPDSPRDIEIRIRTRFQFPRSSQDSNVVQQIFLRDSQATVSICRLQVLNCETSRHNNVLPEKNPAKAKSTAAVVEYPTLAGESRSGFLVGHVHWIRLPRNTLTGEPSATNAESGRR